MSEEGAFLPSKGQVLRCQFQEWYPHFRKVTFRSVIIPLPEDFVAHLMSDEGVFLNSASHAMPRRAVHDEFSAVDNDEYHRWRDGSDDDEAEPEVPSFPELAAAVQTAIDSLGGAVVPKLNWSCPKDTAWVSPSGSVRCNSADEVFLLLKSSDSLVHDLCHAFDNCVDNVNGTTRPDSFALVLRKWYDLRPEMEFRCFVRDHSLIGVSQREASSYYPSLLEREDEVEEALLQFFKDHIQHKFGDKDYTFDAYVTADYRVKLIDFNPYGGATLPLLFTWDELEDLATFSDDDEPRDVQASSLSDVPASESRGRSHLPRDEEVTFEFRIVRSPTSVMPGMKMASGAPFDLFDLSPGGAIDKLISKLQAEGAEGENHDREAV